MLSIRSAGRPHPGGQPFAHQRLTENIMSIRYSALKLQARLRQHSIHFDFLLRSSKVDTDRLIAENRKIIPMIPLDAEESMVQKMRRQDLEKETLWLLTF